MPKTFQPTPETLPNITTLNAIADNIDPERSAQKWREDPPDGDYDGILDAEEVNDA